MAALHWVLIASFLVISTCNELQETLNCLNEYMESLRDTMVISSLFRVQGYLKFSKNLTLIP